MGKARRGQVDAVARRRRGIGIRTANTTPAAARVFEIRLALSVSAGIQRRWPPRLFVASSDESSSLANPRGADEGRMRARPFPKGGSPREPSRSFELGDKTLVRQMPAAGLVVRKKTGAHPSLLNEEPMRRSLHLRRPEVVAGETAEGVEDELRCVRNLGRHRHVLDTAPITFNRRVGVLAFAFA